MFVYHVFERRIDPRLETALNVICEDIGSVDFVTRDFMLRCFHLQRDCRVFVYHVYKRLTDPRLYKVDHFCLSLSRALASCSCFQPRGGTPPKYLYGYVPPNGVVILGLLI